MALMLVLITTVTAAILATAFLSSQGTAIGIATNVRDYTKARYVAESGLDFALAYVAQNTTWRADRPNGTWVTSMAFGEGTFTIVGEDGLDTDGNGTIAVPAEGDGDLSDDAADLMTLTVTGTVGSTTHVARAVITPVASTGSLLFVVPDPSNMSADDASRKQLVEGFGWAVATIDDDDSQASFDAALATAGVAYVSSTASDASVGSKLVATTVGVVSEQAELTDEFGISTTTGNYSGTEIDIVDGSHQITSSFGTGLLTITSSNQALRTATGTVNGITLAQPESNSDATLVVLGGVSTFGDQTVQGTTVKDNAGKIVAAGVTLAEDGTVSSITAYMIGAPSKLVSAAIYTDVAGEPGALIAQSGDVNAADEWAWVTFALPPTPLVAGNYWLTMHFENNSQRWAYGGAGAIRRKNQPYASGPPAPWGASTDTYVGSPSIYATYTPTGGGGPPRVFMPWGGVGFSFATLNGSAQTLLDNALQWAGNTAGGGSSFTYTVDWQ